MSETTNYVITKNKVRVKRKPIHMWNHVKVIYLTTLALTYFVIAIGFGLVYYAVTKPEPDFFIKGLYVVVSAGGVFILGLLCLLLRMIKVWRFYRRLR